MKTEFNTGTWFVNHYRKRTLMETLGKAEKSIINSNTSIYCPYVKFLIKSFLYSWVLHKAYNEIWSWPYLPTPISCSNSPVCSQKCPLPTLHPFGGHKPLSQISAGHMCTGLDYPLGCGHLPVGTSAKGTVSSPQGLSTTKSSSVRGRNWRPRPLLVRILTVLTLGRYYAGAGYIGF